MPGGTGSSKTREKLRIRLSFRSRREAARAGLKKSSFLGMVADSRLDPGQARGLDPSPRFCGGFCARTGNG